MKGRQPLTDDLGFSQPNAAGLPAAAGLYDPAYEHDSCGVGAIAALDGTPRHELVSDAVQILVNLEHRGAVGSDKTTGDGAGLLLSMPDAFFREAFGGVELEMPAPGHFGVGMIFLPSDEQVATSCVQTVEKVAAAEGAQVLGWRDVPVDASGLGELSVSTMPQFRQVLLGRGAIKPSAFERSLYVIRRLIEKEIEAWQAVDASQFYVASLSSRTIVYKGMLTGAQLQSFFEDLAAPSFAASFAIVHQRYSTNTLPTWHLAQPFRLLAHNGEINTLRGNVNRMRAREAKLESSGFGRDLERLRPIIVEGGSDSAMADNMLELLVLGGRTLPHAMMMMIPEAWGAKYHLSEDKRAFYEFHSAVMEPWDGPAAMVFTDGRYLGGVLDRNGLRPARYTVTTDGLVVIASETGVIDFAAHRLRYRGRLQPGRMLLIDMEQHRIVPDREIKATVSRRQPYRHWVRENAIELRGLFVPSAAPREEPHVLRQLQHAFGYTEEELKMVIGPMAARGQEAVGSMGNDEPLAVLSNRPQLLFTYFKQLFAQVTNPPIDPLREELVMSLMSYIGHERNLLSEGPTHCRQLKLPHPILAPEDLLRLRNAVHPDLVVRELDMIFPAESGGEGLEQALTEMFAAAEKAIRGGATLLVLTDRNLDAERVPMPALLAVSGLHHHLIRAGLRTDAAIVVETGEAREVIHFAMLISFGANAISPRVAFATVRELAETRMLEGLSSAEVAMDNYIAAVKKGLLKTLSRMGISTIRSFNGSQIFECIGISQEVVNVYFTGTASRIGGVGLDEIAREARERHRRAYPEIGSPAPLLELGGHYHVRHGGETHLWTPKAIMYCQRAVREDDFSFFKQYVDEINDQSEQRMTLRSLFAFRPGTPVPLEEVEPVESIVKRFVVSAMSFGSVSKETHESIAIAMNRLDAASNSGEGGEAPERQEVLPNGDSRCSRIKQVASGRFGVTIDYLTSARELQIKIAQGAKPGEGGQLPGHKVTEDIARVRHTMPGVTLISPPPHHDIYSIEDLAQLIYDLKCANSQARVSVKLVSEVGVGTIATGVAKAQADMVQIAGYDGGTGASPLTAIKHAGLPWELGLAETQQCLRQNGLRGNIRVQVDGQLRTGRDLAIAALMGAEEFGFATPALISLGCIMMRKCHSNTCPVGVATQDPRLRARFTGKPEHVERFMRFIAQDLRELMARLGFRTIAEMVGQHDRLEFAPAVDHWKAKGLDLQPLLHPPAMPEKLARRCMREEFFRGVTTFDQHLIEQSREAIEDGKPVHIEEPVRNIHRTVGARLSEHIVRRHGAKGLPDGTIDIVLKGSAGQSLGAFLAPGVTLTVIGDVNDYTGKGLSGGRIIIRPPEDAPFVPHENVIAGNVMLYGATSGELYVRGLAGERFAVRNSGVEAVVEGVGDHGCEYMTSGTVVVLGPTGNNFAAGMSGGTAYIYDETGLFDTNCNLDMVDVESVWSEDDQATLKRLLGNHVRLTDSTRAEEILDNWDGRLPYFVKVMPIEYRRVLTRMRRQEDRNSETVPATEEVFAV